MEKKHKNIKHIGFEEFQIRCQDLANEISTNKNIKYIFGVPKAGLIPAVQIAYMAGLPLTFAPNGHNTAIIDDCLDSGATRHSFANFPYFFPLIDKQFEKVTKWVRFWWIKDDA